jgi:hypothetical protein
MIVFLIIIGYLIGFIGLYRFCKWAIIVGENREDRSDWDWFDVIGSLILSIIWPLGWIVIFIVYHYDIADYIKNKFPKPPKWL